MQHRLAVIILLLIVGVVYAGYFCHHYILVPSRKANKSIARLDAGRERYLAEGSAAGMEPWRRQYVEQGDKESRRHVMNSDKQHYRGQHQTIIWVSLTISSISLLLAIAIALTTRRADDQQRERPGSRLR